MTENNSNQPIETSLGITRSEHIKKTESTIKKFHKGIKIKWEEEDKRIYEAIDRFLDHLSDTLQDKGILAMFAINSVTAHEGALIIFWKYNNPSYQQAASKWNGYCDNDYWVVYNYVEQKMISPNFSSYSEIPSRIIDKQDRYEVLKRQKWNCNICHIKLKYSGHNNWEGEIAHIDHIHPYSAALDYSNGSENINELSNLQALCPSCNMKKGDKKGW